MNKLLLTCLATAVAAAGPIGRAGAADTRLPVKVVPLPVAVAPSWTGCFIGGHVGLATGHTTWADAVPNGAIDTTFTGQTANTDRSGGIYGGQIGCDYQTGNFVLGLEGSLSGTNLAGTNQDQFNSTWTLRSKTDWLASATGRLGFTINNAMIYGRGGGAWTRSKFEVENTAVFDGAPTKTRSGWVVGAGAEWALVQNWSVFVEGNYYMFGNTSVPFAGDIINPTMPFLVRTKETVETLKFGVNYRFGSDLGLATRY
jgi:outer membrane immunogenic protein